MSKLITVIHDCHEYKLQVSLEDTAEVLSLQLYSLCEIEMDDQLLLTFEGKQVLPDDVFTTFAAYVPLLFLFHRSNDATCFDPLQDSDWRETCSRLISPQAPLLQHYFKKENGSILCRSCATICHAPDQLLIPVSNTPDTRQAIQSQFITDITIVLGGIDVLPPTGYTKIPVDLNYGTPGEFAFLCYRCGGKQRPIAHLQVVQVAATEDSVPNVQGYTTLATNLTPYSSMHTYLCYIRVPPSNFRFLQGYGVCDLSIGNLHSPKMVVCSQPLSESRTLAYDIAPLASSICQCGDSCLFQVRLKPTTPLISFTSLSVAQVQAGLEMDKEMRQYWTQYQDKEFFDSESSLFASLESSQQRVLVYERSDMQAEALKVIPVALLEERARANTSSLHTRFEDEVLHQLIHWFKREFFTWMNNPPCHVCKSTSTQSIGTRNPCTPEEIDGEASRVEMYECQECHATPVFPRYNNPVKLLQSRIGRCGEWANCFTLCCRAMGYEARYVHDYTDHVWTEVFSPAYDRWLHCDPCEDQLDCPLTYEVGWGKELNYIFAFSKDEVVDVIRRYTVSYDDVLDRRTRAREEKLFSKIASLNMMIQMTLPWSRREVLQLRSKKEEAELNALKKAKESEAEGRVSGSNEWKDSRNESGNKTSTESTSVVEKQVRPIRSLLQTLLLQMIQGCSNGPCNNPFCICTFKTKPDFNPTNYTATALKMFADLQQIVSSPRSLEQLLTSSHDLYMTTLLNASPLAFWPLNDDNSLVLDISGHGHHAKNHEVVFGKPLATKMPKNSLGVQVFHQHPLIFPSVTIPDKWMLVFLAQLHSYSSLTENTTFLAIEELNLILSVTKDFKLELQLGSTKILSSQSLDMDRTYHISIVFDKAISIFINGIQDLKIAANSVSTLTLSVKPTFDAIVPIISHVALLPSANPMQIAQYSRQSIPGPKLTVCGVQGDSINLQSYECTNEFAQADSGVNISTINMWSREFFDGVEFLYGDAIQGLKVLALSRMNQAPDFSTKLLPNEVIIKVSGRRGAWMDCLTLTTNFNRTFSAGGNGGNPFEVDIPFGHMVRGFDSHGGDHIDNFVAFTCPAPKGVIYQTLEKVKATPKSSLVKTFCAGVLRYLNNIASNPTEVKFHRIKCANNFFTSNIAILNAQDIKDVFTSAGFQMTFDNQFWQLDLSQLYKVHGAIYDMTTFLALEKL
ncbi:peptide-N(4)-(N-acetyl-beta-glucosaminyl)asparagine amidase [Thraustotheca clavata]|uniref:Peptide-N(4)-(N-acetyl-beta-glucosaminyl)asparagine amidase n=1 Tax=Thraustotheca clavata TaxID=74557 RepID=A0A1V9Z8G7_9STRA|nr:peptide-N(4)-(N-acetyl-beta-glucosaminyl)asparagine amidase [Thraustotheca clavata]